MFSTFSHINRNSMTTICHKLKSFFLLENKRIPSKQTKIRQKITDENCFSFCLLLIHSPNFFSFHFISIRKILKMFKMFEKKNKNITKFQFPLFLPTFFPFLCVLHLHPSSSLLFSLSVVRKFMKILETIQVIKNFYVMGKLQL